LFQVKFFDQVSSPSILPSNPLFSLDVAESAWPLGGDFDSFWSENSMERTFEQPSIGGLYKSFANMLIPCGQSQDQLDANKRLEEELPSLLANMPEKYRERDSIIQTLLGPPQLGAALRLLEIVVYLYSNNLLNHDSSQSNAVLHWIVETIPFENLRTILRTRLPTLQAFQAALFIFGIRTGRICFVRDLLELNVGLEDFVCYSDDPLRVAVSVGSAEMVELILNAGFDVRSNRHDSCWRGALIHDGLTIEIASLLVKAGADVTTKIFDEYVPLTAAVSRGKIELATYLIGAGANVNAETSLWGAEIDGMPEITTLRMAVATSRLDLVQLLLDHGADVHAVCKGRQARERPYYGLASLRESSLNFTATALQAAVAGGDIEMVVSLLEAGSNINEPAHGDTGQTALHTATSAEFVNIVELLLRRGARVDTPGTTSLEYPRTVLLTAVEKGNLDLVKVLLNFGADPNIPAFSYYGTTVLEAARARTDRTELVTLLLAVGARDVVGDNYQDRAQYMRVQLVQAILRGDIGRCHLLIGKGVEVDMEPIECSDCHRTLSVWTGKPMTKATILH